MLNGRVSLAPSHPLSTDRIVIKHNTLLFEHDPPAIPAMPRVFIRSIPARR